jgi:hypothetical protein
MGGGDPLLAAAPSVFSSSRPDLVRFQCFASDAMGNFAESQFRDEYGLALAVAQRDAVPHRDPAVRDVARLDRPSSLVAVCGLALLLLAWKIRPAQVVR